MTPELGEQREATVVPDSTSLDIHRQAVGSGLRVATAGTICVIISEWLNLGFAAQAVITAHIVNLQTDHGPFQKGFERVVGRISGVFLGAAAAVFLGDEPGICLAFVGIAQFVVWYLNSAGWLQYAAFHCGLFLAAIAATGLIESPQVAVTMAEQTAVQVLLGVITANIVNFLFGADKPNAIVTPDVPILTPRSEWVSRSMLITTASMISMTVASYTGLPVLQTMVSTMVLGLAPDMGALKQKAFLRGLAAVVAAIYCALALVILVHAAHFTLVVLFLFLALFAAHYIGMVYTEYTYFGLQLGLVVPMILLGPPGELSDLAPVFLRFAGILAGTAIAFVVVAIWPHWRTTASVTNSQTMPQSAATTPQSG